MPRRRARRDWPPVADAAACLFICAVVSCAGIAVADGGDSAPAVDESALLARHAQLDEMVQAALSNKEEDPWAARTAAICGYISEIDLFLDPRMGARHAAKLLVAHNDLGFALAELGLWRDAVAEMQEAVLWLSALGAETYEKAPEQPLLWNIVVAQARGRESAVQARTQSVDVEATDAHVARNGGVAERLPLAGMDAGDTVLARPPHGDTASAKAIERMWYEYSFEHWNTSWPSSSSQTGSAGAPTIAIATLCAYDPSESSMPPRSIDNKLRYARRHGYKFFVDTRSRDDSRPVAWSKVLTMLQYLGEADWLMWMDCDTLVMNPKRRIEDLLPHAGDGFTDSAAEADSVHMVVSRDALMVNTGVFLLRNCDWSRRMLKAMYRDQDWPLMHHRLWEQASFAIMLSMERHRVLKAGCEPQPDATPNGELPLWSPSRAAAAADEVRTAETDDGGDAVVLGRHVRFVPQRWINAYPMKIAMGLRIESDKPIHAPYEDGDFIVSLSGCAANIGDACGTLFEQLYDDAAANMAGSAGQSHE